MTHSVDYHNLSQQLAAARSYRSAAARLRQICPHIARQVETDCRRRGPLSFWGDSSNHDELADARIVPDTIIKAIAHIGSHNLSPQTPHAGLQHTYGYLFSTLLTPFGYKRERWLADGLSRQLGLDGPGLTPHPEQGTLLANATWLAGKIAFHNTPALDKLSDYLAGKVDHDVVRLSQSTADIVRIEETVRLISGNGRRFQISLRTDLVCWSHVRSADPLLIYSFADSRQPLPRLVTLFSVSQDTKKQLIAQAEDPRREQIRPRYNAVIQGFDTPASGQVRVLA